MESFHFKNAKNILIIGAGHGIGLALVEYICRHYSGAQITATYRDVSKAHGLLEVDSVNSIQVDPTDQQQLETLATQLKEVTIDAIIICAGVLECGEKTPEKSLRHFKLENMANYFLINTFVTPLVAKTFRSNLSTKSPGLFATLSAKVGSLEDNKIGGWASYRASKAALNMYLMNIAYEFKQNKLPYRVLTLHPGTVETELSRPFLKTVEHKVWTSKEAAENLVQVMNQDRHNGQAYFVDYKNDEIAW